MLRQHLVVWAVRVPEPGRRNAREYGLVERSSGVGLHIPCGPPGPEAAGFGWRGMWCEASATAAFLACAFIGLERRP